MSNAEQIEYWNGDAGKRWAQEDATMARLLEPVCEALLSHAAVEGSQRAMDIGCGGGSQSLMLARRLGPDATVLGVDISQPMLQVAQDKVADAGNVAQLSFLQADAASHEFTPASFDLLFSRFGVMFFDDPVSAFRNLRAALRSDGKLAFSCWQAAIDNEWTRVPLQAALQHVPMPEMPDPHAPGPFAFADAERVRAILDDSGFGNIAIEPFTYHMRFGNGSTLGQTVRELAMIGPVSRLLTGQEPATMEKVFASMEEVMAPYFHDGALLMPGAIWFVTAEAGA